MKKIFLTLLVSVFVISLSAQERGKVRVGLDGGLGLPNLGFGLNGNLDVRYNVMDNLNVGVKFNPGFSVRDVVANEAAMTVSATFSFVGSTLITSDYYFNDGSSGFAPFLGGGFGLFDILNMGLSADGNDIPTPPSSYSLLTSETKFGGLLRGGFEAGHFRLGLEYYLIPKSSLYDMLTASVTETTSNSFLNVTIGFYLGGGKWKK